VRDQLGAAIFGASILNSAFLTAFRLPNLFRRLLGEGSLTAGVPADSSGRTARDWKTRSLCAAQQGCQLAHRGDGHAGRAGDVAVQQSRRLTGQDENGTLVADLTVILFPYLAFVCIAAALNATLNVFQRFTEPALSPIWLNLSMIATLGGAGLHLRHADGRAALAVRGRADWRIFADDGPDGSVDARRLAAAP